MQYPPNPKALQKLRHFAKPIRTEDPALLRWVVEERDRACLYGMFHGGCQFGLDPHHLQKRSQGGSDVKENVITLCRRHHDMAEESRIPVSELQGIMEIIYGYTYSR